MRSTKYFFERYFFEGTKGLNIHYICPNCHEYLGFEECNRCGTCNVTFTAKECVKAGAFLITKSMESQLKDLFESGTVFPFIERNNTGKNDFGEIVTGQNYKTSEMRTFLNNRDNFTMSFNTDGVQVFNSSTYQIWPIFASLNEVASRFKSRSLVWLIEIEIRYFSQSVCGRRAEVV